MTNVAGQPTIVPLAIPDGWCPSGTTWQAILQEYQEQFLAGASIQIPGFGAVDLTQIAQLVTDVATLQQQMVAVTKEERTGTLAAVTLNGVTTMIFAAMPDTNYRVNVIPVDAGGAITGGDFSWSLVPNSKTLTQFQIRTHNMPATFTLDWWIRQL